MSQKLVYQQQKNKLTNRLVEYLSCFGIGKLILLILSLIVNSSPLFLRTNANQQEKNCLNIFYCDEQ